MENVATFRDNIEGKLFVRNLMAMGDLGTEVEDYYWKPVTQEVGQGMSKNILIGSF